MDKQAEFKLLNNWLVSARRFMAFDFEHISTAEKLVATIGGILGITLIVYISYQVTGASGAALIVPSMGASAVLVFAVPHGKLSQPWPLIGGNLISSIVGVSCYKLIPDPFLASGLAVGLAIGAMHISGCIHPPGGATALAAVIGGPAINDLGYSYVISPILLNVVIIFIAAILFNSVFPWRRYPVATMMRFTDKKPTSGTGQADIVDKHAIELALADMDLVMDVTIEDLQRVIQLSLDHARHNQLTPQQIKLGHFYTNGKHGPDWSVRRIIDESCSSDPRKDMVIFRVVEGHGFNSADSCTRAEFAHWAAREVFENANA
jgi:CBS-domain-containing membrane protein